MPKHLLSSPWFARIALVLAVAALAWRAAAVTLAALAGIDFPLALDYGEGAVLPMAIRITGQDAYGDITRYPFLVFAYPPIYMLAIRGIAATGVDLLVAGRALAIAASLAIAALIGVLVHTGLGRRCPPLPRLVAAVCAALLFIGSWAMARWMPFARVDTLAIALTLGGLLVALRAPERHWAAYAAAMLFTLSIYTRQTTLAAPLVATLLLVVVNPRAAMRMVMAGLAISLVLLGIWTVRTEGGFLRHLITHNMHYYDWSGLEVLLIYLLVQISVVALGLLGAVESMRRVGGRSISELRRKFQDDPGARAVAAIFLYAAISTPLVLFIMRIGATVNYLLEWIAASAMLIGLLLGWFAQRAFANSEAAMRRALPVVAASAALIVQVAVLPDPQHFLLRDKAGSVRMAEALIEEVRAAPSPVLSDEIILLIRAGKEVPWEPGMFKALANLGRWDERLLADRIRAGYFAFVVTLSTEAYSPAVRAAVEETFPRIEDRGWLVLRRPE